MAKFIGKICEKHLELEGERLPAHGYQCVGCAEEKRRAKEAAAELANSDLTGKELFKAYQRERGLD